MPHRMGLHHDNLGPTQTAAHVTIIDGQLLLVRTYADASMTAALHDGSAWGCEYDLAPEAVTQ